MRWSKTRQKGTKSPKSRPGGFGRKMDSTGEICIVYLTKWHRMKFFCDFFVGSLGSLRFLPYFCIAIGTQGSLAKSQRA